MVDYYAKSERRAKVLLARLTGKDFPDFAKGKSRYVVDIPQENRDTITRFDDEIVSRGLTNGCRIHYLRVLEAFCSKCNKPFGEVTKSDMVAFLKFITTDYVSKNYHTKLSPATVRHYKTGLKYFFAKFYEGNKEVDRDSRGVPLIVSWIKRENRDNVIKKPEDMLSQKELKSLINACDNPRDKAIISVLYEGALRASELLEMKNNSVKFDKYGAVISVVGKTGQRTVRLVNSVPDLMVWMNCHPLKNQDSFFLWTGMRRRVPREFETNNKGEVIQYGGKKLQIKGLQNLVYRLKAKTGIKKRVHPHLLRHTRLTELAKVLTEQELKIFAGWTPESKMASQYVHLSGRDIDNSILRINGIVTKEQKTESLELKPIKCPRCQEQNPATAKFCYKCSMILDLKTAMEIDETKQKDDHSIRDMMERMTKMNQSMQDMFEEMSELKKEQILVEVKK